MPVRLIICGARNYTDFRHVHAVLDMLELKRGISLVITNGGWGVDRFAQEWSRGHRVPAVTADNVLTLFDHSPDGVVAFPGKTRTAAVLAAAQRKGVPIYQAPPAGALGEHSGMALTHRR